MTLLYVAINHPQRRMCIIQITVDPLSNMARHFFLSQCMLAICDGVMNSQPADWPCLSGPSSNYPLFGSLCSLIRVIILGIHVMCHLGDKKYEQISHTSSLSEFDKDKNVTLRVVA